MDRGLHQAHVGVRVLRARGQVARPRHDARKSLPSEYYLSAEIFARERERIFSREWFCAGPRRHAARGRAACACSNFSARASSRADARGRLARALQRVPPSRSARSVARATRRRPTRSGARTTPGPTASTAAPRRAVPEPGPDPSGRRISLYPVGIEVWGGFFFLNLWPAGPGRARPSRPRSAPIPERLARYPLASLATAHRIDYDVAANWKVVAENYNECYHCAGVHPELCEVVPAFKEGGGAGLDWEHGIPHRDGAFTFTKQRHDDAGGPSRALRGGEGPAQGRARLSEPLPLSLARPRRRVPPDARGARPHARSSATSSSIRPRWRGRASTLPTPSSSGTSSTARTGRSARRSSAACPRASTASATTRRWRTRAWTSGGTSSSGWADSA